MKFWELDSICRDQPRLFAKVLSKQCWRDFEAIYKDFPELVRKQDRTKLDAVVPKKLSIEVLEQHPGQVFRSDNILRSYRLTPDDQSVRYLDIFQQHGGSILEEILEKGSKKV